MADWDADDFEPDTATGTVTTMPSDKWDGEDEEDDIKVIQSNMLLSSTPSLARECSNNKVSGGFRMPGMPSQMKTSPRSPRSPSL